MIMSKYYYADGATHHDHHKEMTINVSGKTDIAALMKAFMADDAEVVEEVQEEINTIYDTHYGVIESNDYLFPFASLAISAA